MAERLVNDSIGITRGRNVRLFVTQQAHCLDRIFQLVHRTLFLWLYGVDSFGEISNLIPIRQLAINHSRMTVQTQLLIIKTITL